jgi:hypothetical protein
LNLLTRWSIQLVCRKPLCLDRSYFKPESTDEAVALSSPFDSICLNAEPEGQFGIQTRKTLPIACTA